MRSRFILLELLLVTATRVAQEAQASSYSACTPLILRSRQQPVVVVVTNRPLELVARTVLWVVPTRGTRAVLRCSPRV